MQMVTKLKAELGNSRKMIDTTIEGFKEDYAKTQEELREKQHKVQAGKRAAAEPAAAPFEPESSGASRMLLPDPSWS